MCSGVGFLISLFHPISVGFVRICFAFALLNFRWLSPCRWLRRGGVLGKVRQHMPDRGAEVFGEEVLGGYLRMKDAELQDS